MSSSQVPLGPIKSLQALTKTAHLKLQQQQTLSKAILPVSTTTSLTRSVEMRPLLKQTVFANQRAMGTHAVTKKATAVCPQTGRAKDGIGTFLCTVLDAYFGGGGLGGLTPYTSSFKADRVSILLVTQKYHYQIGLKIPSD